MSNRKRKPFGALLAASLLAATLLCTFLPAVAHAMQVFVKIDVAGQEDTITLEVEPTDTIDAVRQKIHERMGVLPERQALTFGGTMLENGRTLMDYGIQKDATLNLEHYFIVLYYPGELKPGEDAGSMPDQQFTPFEPFTLSESSYDRNGYTFAGWNTSPDGTGEQYAEGQQISLDHDLVLFAQWSKNAIHTVSFVSNGDLLSQATVDDGQLVAAPSRIAAEEMRLTGWFTDEACTKAFDFSTPIERDITLFAGWEQPSKGELGSDSASGGVPGEVDPGDAFEGQESERDSVEGGSGNANAGSTSDGNASSNGVSASDGGSYDDNDGSSSESGISAESENAANHSGVEEQTGDNVNGKPQSPTTKGSASNTTATSGSSTRGTLPRTGDRTSPATGATVAVASIAATSALCVVAARAIPPYRPSRGRVSNR